MSYLNISTSKIREDDIQIVFKNWCDKQDFILAHWHVPNGIRTSLKEAARFKKLGLKMGVPDYWVLLNNKKLLVIEFKTKEGTLANAQKSFLKTLDYCGINNRVCRSAYEAVVFVKENL